MILLAHVCPLPRSCKPDNHSLSSSSLRLNAWAFFNFRPLGNSKIRMFLCHTARTLASHPWRIRTFLTSGLWRFPSNDFSLFQLKSAGQMPYTPGQWLPRENFYVRQDWPNFDSKFVSMLTFLRLTRRTSRLSNWLGIQSNLFLLETFELEFTRALLAYTAISNVQRL